jgi:hypothetical protein
VAGLGTESTHSYQAIFGKYNDKTICSQMLFAVGNGSEENRSNALTVFADGRVSIGAPPSGELDVVTKGWITNWVTKNFIPSSTKVVVNTSPWG